MNMNEHRAELRAQVKIAEKKVRAAKERETLIANKIRVALKAGMRSEAEKFAMKLNEARDDLAFAEQQLKVAQGMESKGRAQVDKIDKDLKRVKAMEALSKAQEGLADIVSKVTGQDKNMRTDDMIRKIEEQNALQEARMDIAMEDAKYKGQLAEFEEASRKLTAEDIVQQMELDMGVEGDKG